MLNCNRPEPKNFNSSPPPCPPQPPLLGSQPPQQPLGLPPAPPFFTIRKISRTISTTYSTNLDLHHHLNQKVLLAYH